MTCARCDSQARQTMHRRSSSGGVIVLLSLASKPLSGIDSGRRRLATPQHRRSLTRSRQQHLESAPVQGNPDDDAVPKSP